MAIVQAGTVRASCPASWRSCRGRCCRNDGNRGHGPQTQPLGLRGPCPHRETWGPGRLLLWSWLVPYDVNPRESRYLCQVYKCEYIPSQRMYSQVLRENQIKRIL